MRTPATSLLTLMLACGTAVAPAMANDAPWRNPGQAQSQRHEQRSNDYPRSDRRQGNDRQDNRYRNDGRRDDRRYGQQGNDRRGDWNAPPRGSHYQDRRIPPPRYMHPGYGRVGYGFQPGHVPRYHPVPARPVVYRAPPRPGYWYPGARYYDRGYGPTVVVNNYGAYGLLPPPPGYAWRRSSVGDFILVAAATGIIVDVLFGR